jgi:hypothetical protein
MPWRWHCAQHPRPTLPLARSNATVISIESQVVTKRTSSQMKALWYPSREVLKEDAAEGGLLGAGRVVRTLLPRGSFCESIFAVGAFDRSERRRHRQQHAHSAKARGVHHRCSCVAFVVAASSWGVSWKTSFEQLLFSYR